MLIFILIIFRLEILFLDLFGPKNQSFWFKLKFGTYNVGHNILELCNILVQIRLTTSKMKRDI